MRRTYPLFVLACLLIVCGCSMMGSRTAMYITRVNHVVKPWRPAILEKTLIEGENRVVFAVTPEEKEKYIPKTVWREKEQAVLDETCSFKLVKSSVGLDKQVIEEFLSGQTKELQLRAGDFLYLEIGAPYWLSELGASAKGELSVVVTDEFMEYAYDNIAFPTSSIAVFDKPLLCRYLKVKATTDEGAVINSLYAKGKPVLASQILRDMRENSIVGAATDSSNPLSVYRKPMLDSYYQLAEKLLEGAGTLSPHQKMMIFMDYISDYYVGLHRKGDILEEYIGSCGTYSNLMAALAYTQGIPARLLTLANYPENTGHAVLEVFYDKNWHLYDPLYGAYYTTSPIDEVMHPAVLGYYDLAQGRGNNADVTCVVTAPSRLIAKFSYGYLGPWIYEKANPKGVVGPGDPLIYPLKMEVTANGSTVVTEKDFSGKYQGISYIGQAGINNAHEWMLEKLEPGEAYEFIISAKYVGGEKKEPFLAKAASDDAKITEGAEHVFVSGDKSSYVWEICFVPEADEAKIMLTHDYRGPELHYVMFSSFELHCAE